MRVIKKNCCNLRQKFIIDGREEDLIVFAGWVFQIEILLSNYL